VAFDHDPAIVAVNPMVGDPMRTGMGWAIPTAWNPDVAATVPALISVNPHKAALRRRRTTLDDGGRRADANHNLRKGRCRRQTES